MPHKSSRKSQSFPEKRSVPASLAQARKLTKKKPDRADSWHALGMALAEVNQWQEAREALQRADRLTPHHPEILEGLARTTHKCGNPEEAVSLFEASLRQDPNSPQAHFSYAHLLLEREQYSRALAHIDRALDLVPGHLDMLSHRGVILYRLHRYSEAIQVFDQLLERQPDHYSHWNNAANLRRDLGLLDEADVYYKESIKRTKHDAKPYSNRLTALHYNPHVPREAILDVCRQWERNYAPRLASLTPAEMRQPNKTLRIGMISDGFRQHPVGRMIHKIMAIIPKYEIELLAYSTNSAVDPLTISIQRSVDQWMSVTHMTDEQLGQQILDDKIDILMDLCGHNAGSRMPTMAMKPAPVQVKWVGGLINTTGLSTMDYLLSDSIETPEGEDEFYVEKLIRLPDDYICYDPGQDQPDPGPLPATRNGHVTFGCFNNPSKINETVLTQWALIMHELPESQLFLKGFQFNSDDLCQRVRTFMKAQGIAPERVIIEGPSPHLELMEAYRRVDIALDPWPYSGGLTTCEALIMGVPVVTLPGPTFAGRHSATHLVNAGMPELVVNSWDEYRERTLELASDLDSLAVIRTHLRKVLLESPVCDAKRFATHFTAAMRAIWQRHCEGKKPAALTFNKDGQVTFEDESQPVDLMQPEPSETTAKDFSWNFKGKVIVLDNGAKLMQRSAGIDGLLKLGAFGVVAFDPASRVASPERFTGRKDVQLLPHSALGDGSPATLYATLDSAASATLEPLPAERLRPEQAQATRILTSLPINTITLDSIEGLASLDWLILDDKSDAMAVLENGVRALQDTLLLQVRIAFQPTHRHQPDFSQVSHWASRHGFRFYRFNDERHHSQLPEDVPESLRQATELESADALYLPNHERMAKLTDNQREKLAFLLHTIFGIKDMAYSLLSFLDNMKGEEYLANEGLVDAPSSKVDEAFYMSDEPVGLPTSVDLLNREEDIPKVSVICPTYNHHDFIEDSIKGFLAQKTDFPFEIIIHDDASTDGTQEVVKRYAARYPRLIKAILQSENKLSQGVKPLSYCLAEAQGEYVAICEGDDYWQDPNKLQKQYDFLEDNKDYVCCFHDAIVVEDSKVVSESKLTEQFRRDFSREEMILNDCFILTLSMMFRKVFTVLPREMGMAGNGDNFIIAMLGRYGKAKFMTDLDPAVYRKHADSSWSSKDKYEKGKMLARSFSAIDSYHERLGLYDIASSYKKKVEYLRSSFFVE